jgi:hypothetical protein
MASVQVTLSTDVEKLTDRELIMAYMCSFIGGRACDASKALADELNKRNYHSTNVYELRDLL